MSVRTWVISDLSYPGFGMVASQGFHAKNKAQARETAGAAAHKVTNSFSAIRTLGSNLAAPNTISTATPCIPTHSTSVPPWK